MNYSKNVFINCPFDQEYSKLSRVIVFTLLCYGLNPRISKTKSSGHHRLDQIKRLMKESKYSIHDLSRSKLGEIPRFNMPFELGLDLGCQFFGGSIQRKKVCLILDKSSFKYKRVISDISGQDIKNHKNNPQKMISVLREWLIDNGFDHRIGASLLWNCYGQFWADTTPQFRLRGVRLTTITSSEFILWCKEWLKTPKAVKLLKR